MGLNTQISWCDATWNPWWGCTKVSPGCDHCYADRDSKRYGFQIWGKDAERRFFSEKHWQQPRLWNQKTALTGKRMRVFCASMSDVMEDRRDLDAWRDKLYELIYETPHLDWLLLTKRPQNFRRLLPPSMIANPLPNVWGMTTVESAEYYWRIEALIDTPFAVRGISYEPAIGPIDLTVELYTGGIDWVIAGGESGPGARPAPPEWFRSVRDQCQAHGVAYFFKQWGEWSPAGPHDAGRRELVPVGDGTHHAMFRVGKKAAGALLDGREHKELPR